MASTTSRFEVFAGKNGKFYFRLKVQSGESILSSHGYALRDSARRAIQSVRDHASDAACYVEKKNKAGKSYFLLVARNSKAIGVRYTVQKDSRTDRFPFSKSKERR